MIQQKIEIRGNKVLDLTIGKIANCNDKQIDGYIEILTDYLNSRHFTISDEQIAAWKDSFIF